MKARATAAIACCTVEGGGGSPYTGSVVPTSTIGRPKGAVTACKAATKRSWTAKSSEALFRIASFSHAETTPRFGFSGFSAFSWVVGGCLTTTGGFVSVGASASLLVCPLVTLVRADKVEDDGVLGAELERE
jgi:hypothetical protein